MSGQVCQNCVFWVQDPNQEKFGACRRSAPRPYVTDVSGGNDPRRDAWWPVTYDTDWCGEWQPWPDENS
jgi:hypothetical protein